jgi:aryl-alcohol dehydrogenase-like predicted oxidoreductase
MRSVLLGRSGLRVSELCLGTATFGVDGWGSDREEARRIFDLYLDAGGRFIDTSNTYGEGRAEKIVGELVSGRRDELVIGTKFTAITRPGDPNAWGNHRKSIRQSLRTSLQRLNTDYVDIIWMHTWEGITPLDEVMRAIDDEVHAGTVLYAGVSNTPAWAVARANTLAELKGWTPFVGLQTEYSLVSRTPEHELLPMAHYLGLTPFAWSPLAAGLLAGGYPDKSSVTGTRLDYDTVSPRRLELARAVADVAKEIGQPTAAVALAWLRQRPIPVLPILGARTSAQLGELLGFLDLSLPEELLARLDELTEPPPIMPREGLDMPGVDTYFHGGTGDGVTARNLAVYPKRPVPPR